MIVLSDKNYFINEEYNIQTQSTYADNLDLDAQNYRFNTEDTSDDILDFTERNPFGGVDFLMFGHFYNEGMRKMTVKSTAFNNIQIKRTEPDSTIQSIRVPLSICT